MKDLYGLVGYPLGHSFSKDYFLKKFRQEGIDAEYQNFSLEHIEQVSSVFAEHPELKGLNVTIPYKTAIIPYLDGLSEEAKKIGAVNVVKIFQNKKIGYNTDYEGFLYSIKDALPSIRQALILGSGGVSKAVQYALETKGIQTSLVGRNSALDYEQVSKIGLSTYQLIVQATPLGMYPNIDSYPEIPYQSIQKGCLCYDLVYNPSKTKFMQLAEAAGAEVMNGMLMLHTQAEAAWKIWQT